MLSLVSLSGMIFLMTIIIWQMHDNIFDERRQLIRSQVVTATGLLDNIYEQYSRGELNQEAAKQMAMSHLDRMQYPGNGYFWILDKDGLMLMHPYSKDTVGTSTWDFRDTQGRFFVREFITAATNGGGFVSYDWERPNGGSRAEKIAYVTQFRPWGWIIGTGLYVDDLHIQALKQISVGSALIFILFIFNVIISLRLSRKYIGEFRHSAIYDALTGLFTRGYLDEIGDRMLQRSRHVSDRKLAAIFLDIDHFKKVNDNYGHRTGDYVLAEVGDILRKFVRPNELSFRYGGEELVVLLYASLEEGRNIAERIRLEVSEHNFSTNDHKMPITVSIGVAIHNGSETLSALLRRADSYMYQAKQRGRNCTVTESDL